MFPPHRIASPTAKQPSVHQQRPWHVFRHLNLTHLHPTLARLFVRLCSQDLFRHLLRRSRGRYPFGERTNWTWKIIGRTKCGERYWTSSGDSIRYGNGVGIGTWTGERSLMGLCLRAGGLSRRRRYLQRCFHLILICDPVRRWIALLRGSDSPMMTGQDG